MKLITRSKRAALVGLVGILAAVVPGSPAHATAAVDIRPINAPDGAPGLAECAAVGATTNGSTMDLVVRGTANIAGATNISLVCHVWQSNKHGHVGGVSVTGSAVAAGVVRNFNLAPYTICAEVFIVTLNGSYHYPCPAH
ncbi:MAG TPA: hypothetical protein VHN37_07715 [Actinomycetota bacterium]|nr:hypothetical protein [Actinomycetota bacterium]